MLLIVFSKFHTIRLYIFATHKYASGTLNINEKMKIIRYFILLFFIIFSCGYFPQLPSKRTLICLLYHPISPAPPGLVQKFCCEQPETAKRSKVLSQRRFSPAEGDSPQGSWRGSCLVVLTGQFVL